MQILLNHKVKSEEILVQIAYFYFILNVFGTFSKRPFSTNKKTVHRYFEIYTVYERLIELWGIYRHHQKRAQ